MFNVTYSIVTIIGAILCLLAKENIRKCGGLIMLIVANLIPVPFFVANCVLSIASFILRILGNLDSLIIASASLGVVLCVFQCGLFVLAFVILLLFTRVSISGLGTDKQKNIKKTNS